MKSTANEKRLETMRANLTKLETLVKTTLDKGDAMTTEDHNILINALNIAYHTSGKIEEAASIDGTASCEFCMKMRSAAENNVLIICGACYAAAESWKEAAWRRHKLNALILSSVLFSHEELSKIILPSFICRINEDGDIANETHARNILRIIKTHGQVNFGFWYKNAAAVAGALNAEGYEKRSELPHNVSFVKSSLLIGFPASPDWFTDRIFTVYPDKETTEAAIKANHWECNGRKCKGCKWNCYHNTPHIAPVQYIAEYLRTNAARRAEIMKAYEQKKAEV